MATKTDFLSVGIPVWNDPESIQKSVRAITHTTAWAQRNPADRELIVCVNGVSKRDDATAKAVRDLAKSIPELRVFVLAEKGRNLALNFIARRANPRAKQVFFCDSDVLVKRETISKVLGTFRQSRSLKFVAADALPATRLVPEKKRSAFKAYFLERTLHRIRNEGDFVSGAGYAVDRKFFLKNPLPETNNVADDLYINEHFKGRIARVKATLEIVL